MHLSATCRQLGALSTAKRMATTGYTIKCSNLGFKESRNYHPTLASFFQFRSPPPSPFPPHNADMEEGRAFKEAPTNYLVITSSGKPVFAMHNHEQTLVEYGAVLQTIVAFFDESTEPLQTFRAKDVQFVISSEFPLILVAIDRLNQSEAQLRVNLNILYAQILSTLTRTQLTRAFKTRPNRDLRPLLEGTEGFLEALCHEMTKCNPGLWLGAVETLALKKHVRAAIHTILSELRSPDLLYGLVISDKRLAAVIRPRRHSLHPPDLFLLFSMLFNSSAFTEGEHWVPICFPKFNAEGFLYAYIQFVNRDTALVLVSPTRDSFFQMQRAGSAMIHQMHDQQLIEPVALAAKDEPFTGDFGCIAHFIYKSKKNVQFSQSRALESDLQQAIMLEYKRIQAFIQDNKLSVHHKRWNGYVVFGWSSPGFEFYCAASTDSEAELDKDLRKLILWVRKHEERLFIMSGATF